MRVLLRQAAGPGDGEPDLAAIDSRRRRLSWRRRLVVGAAGLLVVSLLAVAAVGLVGERRVDLAGPSTGLDRGSTTFPVPASGQAVAGWLTDHTPVFIVRDRGDEIHVVRGVGPYTQGIDVAVAWCEPTQAFMSLPR